MHSCIYEGRVRHRRVSPRNHSFDYSLFMLYLDLDELPTLFNKFWLWSSSGFNLACFDRSKHLGDPSTPLDESVRKYILQECGVSPKGPIRLLTHMRYFGYEFNPVSFYYCFDEQDEHIEYIVAEVNNTPWGEQHTYILDETINHSGNKRKKYAFKKVFHVSPFMEMDLDYQWSFSHPEDLLFIHMNLFKDTDKLFDATLKMKSHQISSTSLARVLLRYPFMTIKVITSIYFQALKLWLKKIPFHTHPSKKEEPSTAKDS